MPLSFYQDLDGLSQVVIICLLRVIFLLMIPALPAWADLSLHIDDINTPHWQLQGINISLANTGQNRQKLDLTISRLALPKPYHDLALVNIRCDAFSLQGRELSCPNGRAELRSQRWHSPSANFSLYINAQNSRFSLNDLHLAGGNISISGEQKARQWLIHVNAEAIDSKQLQDLLQTQSLALKSGQISVQLSVVATNLQIESVDLNTRINKLDGQTSDGRLAAENLTLTAKLKAHLSKGNWQWQQQIQITNGALYAEPLYLESGARTIRFAAEGWWRQQDNRLDIRSAKYRHGNIASLTGNAVLELAHGYTPSRADISLHSNDLQQFSAIYLQPLFEQTAWEGISLTGRLQANLLVTQHKPSAVTAAVNRLGVNDSKQRITAEDVTGTLNWSDDAKADKPSYFTWRQLKLGKLPVGPASLAILARANTVKIVNKTSLPFLGGSLDIDQFSWKAKAQQEPELYFSGKISKASLEQLTLALNWTPLSGRIDGYIPNVEYRNNTLNLEGEIVINAFDGTVRITDLASTGLFSDYPRLYGELLIDHLDLDQLTQKFKFGGITGKLSGYVRQLTLENWHPVTFYAWLGTPDDDISKHRISQKAVKNIANIGGGAASDLVSRSFLSIFETFGYDKLGIGCYLFNGVCQLMGVDAHSSGYRLIKGGGLPRIDVIGYNPRVDWAVLMDRLSHVSTTDDIKVE